MAEAEARLPNLGVRAGQVFFSPGALFERLEERPAWLGALLLIVLLNVLGGLLVPEEILRQLVSRQLPADADAETLRSALRIARFSGILGGAIVTPILAALLAGLLLVIYNVGLGGEASFRQLFAAVVHALIVLTVGGFLTLLLMIAQGEAGVALALHLLVPGLETESWLYRFLHGLNVFGGWTAAVLGIAVSRIYPSRSARSAALLLLVLYALLKALLAFFPAASGA